MSNPHVTLTLQNMLPWHTTMIDTALQLGMGLGALRLGTGRSRPWAMVMLCTIESCPNGKKVSLQRSQAEVWSSASLARRCLGVSKVITIHLLPRVRRRLGRVALEG